MIEDEVEPDSPEFKALNAFLSALGDANGAEAASALRSLEDLDGYPLELLADLLDNLPVNQRLYPVRIQWKKCGGKGRPKKKPDTSKVKGLELSTATAFFQAIAEGDAAKAAEELRSLKTLHGVQIKLLADLLQPDALLPEGFHWRPQLVGLRPGAKVDYLRRGAHDFHRRRVVSDAFAKHPGKKEAPVQEIMTRTGKARTTVNDLIARLRDPNKKIDN